MTAVAIEPVEVLRGGHKGADPHLFGPLPGRRPGNVIADESPAPATDQPWPGRSRVQRTHALLWVTTDQLVDGLHRWPRFLDRHVPTSRIPPTAIAPLAALPGPSGPPVTWPE